MESIQESVKLRRAPPPGQALPQRLRAIFKGVSQLMDTFGPEEVAFEAPRFLDRFDPDDLAHNTEVYDEVLRDYLAVYEKAGIRPRRYADADAFAAEYRIVKNG